MDILKESWEVSPDRSESIESNVLLMRERLSNMTELVQTNLGKAQKKQKQKYDQTARTREFVTGDKVLVLLLTSSRSVFAQWQESRHG